LFLPIAGRSRGGKEEVAATGCRRLLRPLTDLAASGRSLRPEDYEAMPPPLRGTVGNDGGT
jgi:hypothetical protein